MGDTERNEKVVEIVLSSEEPISSPNVERKFEQKYGERLGQSKVYRILMKALGDGKVQQDSKRRWIPATPKSEQRATAQDKPRTNVISSEARKMAAQLYRHAAEATEKEPYDPSSVRNFTKAAATLLTEG